MDLYSLDNDLLGSLDRAVGGKLIVTTEYMVRAVGADHLDLTVGGVGGGGPPYVLHVHGLDESKEIVRAAVTIPIDDDLDEATKLAVLQVYTACLVARASRESNRLSLKRLSFEKESQNRSVISNRGGTKRDTLMLNARKVRP